MRIATVSHSHIATRQQLFFKEVAQQGNDVLMVGPGEWGNLKMGPKHVDFRGNNGIHHVFEYHPRRHIGDHLYNYRLLGAQEAVEDFKPDWLYMQVEPGSGIFKESLSWNVPLRAVFTWENISLKGTLGLDKQDLVVCGNPEAVALVKPHNDNTLLMLQVGVDTDHFWARPSVERSTSVAFIGRPVEEKGITYLREAWPTARFLEMVDFNELPWWYSTAKVVVAFSQDVLWWKEQAPNYVVLEALSCGCNVVTSDTPAMAYWLKGCPSAVVVEGHTQLGEVLDMGRVSRLREGISKALNLGFNSSGREWVMDNFGKVALAKKLVKALEEKLYKEEDHGQEPKLDEPI